MARAALFDLGEVLLKPGLQPFLSACEQDRALPRGFLEAALDSGGSQSPRSRALRGHAGLSQLLEMLRAAGELRRHGLPPCLRAEERLRRHFRPALQSCRGGVARPDHAHLCHALEALRARPQELLALQEAAPAPVEPEDVTHGFVTLRPGVWLHFVELGQGPALCLCHGFPESWLSWRHQIPALARAGFRVIALEMKGYGESCAPREISEYSQEQICKDFITFLDKLGIPQVILIGHDWGGAMAWNVALFYPERLRAVAVLNTPFRPPDPNSDPLEKLEKIPAFDYQLYFQEPGVAEAELEKDIGRTLKILIRSSSPEDRLPVSVDFRRVRERGGLLVGLPEDPPGSRLLPPAPLEYYIQQFRKSGFRGPLNWYRNVRENWRWALSAGDRKILIPALMVTAGKDPVLKPSLSQGMESWIPKLQRGHIQNCGHWTQLERPVELNRILLDWLKTLGNPPQPFPAKSKL